MTDFLAFTITGLVTGAIYAVAASGLVLTYTTTGIFNFAHGAIGMFAAFVYWELKVNQGWPTPLALIVVIFVLAPLLGAVIERLLMRRLAGASTGVTIVVTLGLFSFLYGGASTIWDPTKARFVPEFFGSSHITLAHVVISYHRITMLAVAVLTAVGLRLVLYRTRVGVTMRAAVDDRELTSLNGGSPERVSQMSWALGAVLAATAGVLLAPVLRLEPLVLSLLVVNGYAAAMLGRLRSLPLTFVGAVVLGLVEAYAIGYGSDLPLLGRIRPVIPTIFLFVILLFLPQARLRAGRMVAGRSPTLPSLRQSLIGAAGFIAAAAAITPLLSPSWLLNSSLTLATALMALSLVLLTGYGGQVSLCQLSFVGAGAFAMGRVAGGNSPLGLIAAALLAGALGLVVSLPALRLQGLYLALSTLAFALFMEQVVFNSTLVFDRGGRLDIGRLHLPGLVLGSERAQFLLLATAFAFGGVGVLALRRGAFGRRLSAMSDSPLASATLGMSLVTTKAAVFSLSAALAGVAGALYGGLLEGVGANDFAMLRSLFFFLAVVIGGVTTVSGALLGGAVLTLLPVIQEQYVPGVRLDGLAIGVGAILIARNPNGFAGVLSAAGARARALRPAEHAGVVATPRPALEPAVEL